MVTKSKTAQEGAGKNKGRVKVGKLKLNRETVRNLTAGDQKKVKGGNADASRVCPNPLPPSVKGCPEPKVTPACSVVCTLYICS